MFMGVPLLSLPEESIIGPEVSFICQSAALSSAAHAGGEAIDMRATTKTTEAKSALLLVLHISHPPSYHLVGQTEEQGSPPATATPQVSRQRCESASAIWHIFL